MNLFDRACNLLIGSKGLSSSLRFKVYAVLYTSSLRLRFLINTPWDLSPSSVCKLGFKTLKDTLLFSETEVINRLYAVNTKKVAGRSPLGYGYESQPSTTSTLSVSDLFDYVKDVDIFQEIMPISSGIERVDSEIGNRLKYSKGLTLEDLGRTKDLVAAHNLSGDKLLASISLGDFVMPSIAVTKDTISHDGFGPITLLFDKNTIDPAKNFKT